MKNESRMEKKSTNNNSKKAKRKEIHKFFMHKHTSV